jgi:3-phenylpropionate/trans-cinnamate dioxygenase ferredoxin reductase component
VSADIVIVGAGQAGARCAQTLRELGLTDAIHLFGAEAGLPYERPPLSKAVLLGQAQPEDAPIIAPMQWEGLGLQRHPETSVIRIDRNARQVALSDGRRQDYRHLVLATGVAPRRLNIQGADLPNVLTLHSATEALAARAALAQATGHLVVIGGGFIGLEAAACAVQLGWRVTVLEHAPHCLSRVMPSPAASLLEDLHRSRGVVIRCGVDVLSIEGDARAQAVLLRDGGRIEADLALMAVGSAPRVELARACGLAVDNGVLTDADGRTSDPAIWAIGDVARRSSIWAAAPLRLESWQNAETSAARAAHAIFGAEPPKEPAPWFWTDQYDVNLQMIGLPKTEHRCVVRAKPGQDRTVLGYFDGDRLSAAVLVNSGQDRRALVRLIEDRALVDPALFADPNRPLAQAVRAAA